jgi:hypothetical protein
MIRDLLPEHTVSHPVTSENLCRPVVYTESTASSCCGKPRSRSMQQHFETQRRVLRKGENWMQSTAHATEFLISSSYTRSSYRRNMSINRFMRVESSGVQHRLK